MKLALQFVWPAILRSEIGFPLCQTGLPFEMLSVPGNSSMAMMMMRILGSHFPKRSPLYHEQGFLIKGKGLNFHSVSLVI